MDLVTIFFGLVTIVSLGLAFSVFWRLFRGQEKKAQPEKLLPPYAAFVAWATQLEWTASLPGWSASVHIFGDSPVTGDVVCWYDKTRFWEDDWHNQTPTIDDFASFHAIDWTSWGQPVSNPEQHALCDFVFLMFCSCRLFTMLTTAQDDDTSQIAVIMVGLPARGKSLIAGKMVRWLKWQNITAQIFNVGKYRRSENPHPDAAFFDVNNKAGEQARAAAAKEAVADMIRWFENKQNKVAFLDATNSTKKRRRWIYEQVSEAGYLRKSDSSAYSAAKLRALSAFFIESKCDDDRIIMHNILDVKTTSPDYVGQDPEKAAKDFRARIANYEKVYETLDESESDYTYVKIQDVGHQLHVNRLQNYTQTRITYFLGNLHIRPRSIWLSRHGESQFNITKQIGGDCDLSPRGEEYAKKLPELLIRSGIPRDQKVVVWTSTLKRTNQTARYVIEELGFRKLEWKALDEIDAGTCDLMTYREIQDKWPDDFKARDDDKYHYRYPGGESYKDVVTRLEPIIMELEREENVIIITHQAVLRCIFAYFMETPSDKSPWVDIPLHTLIKLTPRAYGAIREQFNAGIQAVSTYRARGEVEEGVTKPTVTA
jgi:6-phosphofructo-2-kinase / fructose-2,6-biphosphatase 2